MHHGKKHTRRGKGTRKASRTMRSKRYRGGQEALAAANTANSAAVTANVAIPKTVNIYVKKTSTGILTKDVKSDSPLVSVTGASGNTVDLSLDSKLGQLADWTVKGHSSSGWTVAASAKLNRGGTTIVAESGGKGVRKGAAPAGFQASTQMKLPAALTSLKLKGLEQQNFSAFSSTGNASKDGANICITLTFA